MSVVDRLLHLCSFSSWLFLAIYGFSLASAGCAPSPIPIHIGNVTLSTQETARGLNISVGTPHQPFAFLPQWPLNNSFLYGTNGFCSSSMSDAACATFHGGQYDEFASTSRGVAAANSYPIDTGTYPQCNYITDNFTLNSNVTLGDFPLGIALADWGEQGYFPQMALGLGPNSTILSALKSSGQIASRSWSMFWGRTGGTENTQLDGNFVFGGYDSAKVTGANYTRALSTARSSCSTNMLVTITDMIINFPNGTDASLLGGDQSSAIAACIVPDYPVLMTMPLDPYFQNFEILTNSSTSDRSFGLYYYGMLYDGTTKPFDGDLTIQLDSGLSVRIPNDQLVVPNLSLNSQTGAWVANGSAPELVINSIQQVNAGDLPQIGRQFLTAAYLMLNQDTNSFTLWEANPTIKEDLVAIDSQNNVVEDFCTPTATSAIQTTTSVPAPTASNDIKKKLGGGAIAGIAIGSIAGVAGLVGLIFLFIFKRRKAARDSSSSTAVAISQSPSDTPHTKSYIPQELPGKPFMAQLPDSSKLSPSTEERYPFRQELAA